MQKSIIGPHFPNWSLCPGRPHSPSVFFVKQEYTLKWYIQTVPVKKLANCKNLGYLFSKKIEMKRKIKKNCKEEEKYFQFDKGRLIVYPCTQCFNEHKRFINNNLVNKVICSFPVSLSSLFPH